MKRINLNDTWQLCLKMGKWLAEQIKLHPYSHVTVLKRRWLKLNGFANVTVWADCFFCEHAVRYEKDDKDHCDFCPGRKVDKHFHCREDRYCYRLYPAKFYKEIVRLNKIRLKGCVK